MLKVVTQAIFPNDIAMFKLTNKALSTRTEQGFICIALRSSSLKTQESQEGSDRLCSYSKSAHPE